MGQFKLIAAMLVVLVVAGDASAACGLFGRLRERIAQRRASRQSGGPMQAAPVMQSSGGCVGGVCMPPASPPPAEAPPLSEVGWSAI